MVHPLFRLAAARPQWLAEHLAAYADLLSEELANSATLWRRRVALQIVGLASIAAAVVLGGVAVMLWAALPQGSLSMPWLLIATPALPAVIGLWATSMAGSVSAGGTLSVFRQQLADDAAMLRAATAES